MHVGLRLRYVYPHTGALLYLTTDITLHSNSCDGRQWQWSQRYQFAPTRGPGVLVQCTAVNILYMLTIFKDDGNSFGSQTDVTCSKHAVQ